MELILRDDVDKLGRRGDIVKVKDGFARNYLIPQGKAKRATPGNLAEFERRRGELEKAQADALTAAEARGAKVDGVMVQITRKAGVDGRLFGSVTTYDIAEALQGLGHEVERAAIRLPQGPLKAVGDYPIAIALHGDVVVQITVSVLGEQA